MWIQIFGAEFPLSWVLYLSENEFTAANQRKEIAKKISDWWVPVDAERRAIPLQDVQAKSDDQQ